MRLFADSMHPRTAADLSGAPGVRGPQSARTQGGRGLECGLRSAMWHKTQAPSLVLLGLFLIILGGSLRRGHAEKCDAAAA